MIKAIWRPLCFLVIFMCVAGNAFWKLHRDTKADSRFTISMYQDMGKTARKLKAAGVDEETARAIRYAFEDVYWNVQSYVADRSMWQDHSDLFVLGLLVSLIGAHVIPSVSQKPRRSDLFAMMCRAEAEAIEKKAD